MKPPKKQDAKSAVNKSAFVRSLDASLPVAEVVKVAAAKGIKLSDQLVHTIRYNAKKAAAKRATTTVTPAAPAKRGPGRPRKIAPSDAGPTSFGLVSEIERLVEAKVSALLQERFAALFRQ